MPQETIDVVTMALFISLAITTVVEYLKGPLVNTPRIRAWMIQHGWADDVDGSTVMWWLTYVTFVLGAVVSYLFGIDIVTQFVPNAPPLGAVLMTALIVGGGSNLIHNVTKKN